MMTMFQESPRNLLMTYLSCVKLPGFDWDVNLFSRPGAGLSRTAVS